MSEKASPKYIYFISGYLTGPEQDLSRTYFENLKSVFKAEAPGYILGFKKPFSERSFELIEKQNCSKEDFLKIWKEDRTVGIFWYSHGDPNTGYPWAASADYRHSSYILKPQDLPPSGPNLRSLAILSCGSGKAEDRWREKMSYKNPAIYTITGLLEDGSMDRTDETYTWINESWLSTPQRPTIGARYMMQYAMDDFKPGRAAGCAGCDCNISGRDQVQYRRKQDFVEQMISKDFFEPEQVFVPYRRIPKVETDATHYTAHQIRPGDRVWYLAEDYGYNDRKRFTEDVKKLNPDINVNSLRPGQTINVPTKIGIPKSLRPPYAFNANQPKRGNAFSQPSQLRILDQHLTRIFSPPQAAPPSQLRLLNQQLMRTPDPPTRMPTFDSMDTLKRMEREAQERQNTQRWLQRTSDQLNRRPLTGAAGTPPSTLRILDDHLRQTYTPETRVPAFDTMDALRRLEREAQQRQDTQRWLSGIEQQLNRRPAAFSQMGTTAPSTLSRLDRHLRKF
ncbi:MAG: LysM peptidoglycan-binding domain-containing protein [Methanotrichaceae archaeon]|nr:LysM peptidoglycan-binding domain-containing protein [Methanotrichaceae archaeon]